MLTEAYQKCLIRLRAWKKIKRDYYVMIFLEFFNKNYF